MSRPGGGTVRSSFPFTRLWSAQKRIRFAHRVTRHKGRPLLARLSSMVSPTGRYIDRNLVMAQISTSSSGIESVLELTYFPSSLCSYSVPCLILIELIIHIEIRDQIEPSKRILPIVSIFFFSSTRKSFHRWWWHVPRQEIKPLTIILIVIRGEEGGRDSLLEGADDCVALFKRDMGKSIARLSVGNLAWHRRKVFAESRTRSIIYAITTALCFLKRYEK